MTPERWAQIQEAFDELVTLEPPEQARRLALVSDSDPELGREVESLLDADGGAAEVLDPIQEVISSPGDLVSQEGQQTTADPYGLVGRSVSHYEVTELLGGGGMGGPLPSRRSASRPHRLAQVPAPAVEPLRPAQAALPERGASRGGAGTPERLHHP